MKTFALTNFVCQTRRHICVASGRQNHSVHGPVVSPPPRPENLEDYQLMHRSTLPTMHFQQSLLRLQIPDLSQTCSRYLRSQKAILSLADYGETEKVVGDFEKGVGRELHAQLKARDKANKHTSYISGPWFDMYLSDRRPIVLNYNPFLAFLHETETALRDPVVRATNVLVSSMRFLNTLKQGVLRPEVYHLNPAKSDTPLFRTVAKWTPAPFASYAAYAFKAFPLDMSQFSNLFHSTRVPCEGKDVIEKHLSAKHILFMKRGNLYVFDLFDEEGNLYPPSHIHACVSYIYSDPTPAPEYPVSILTGENRDIWASARQALIDSDSGNEETLRLIDSSAFNIVFDEETVGEDPEMAYRTFLYGNGGNRWFDKSFSLIFSHDGECALNFEHAWGDGVAIMSYFNEVATEVRDRPFVTSGRTGEGGVDGSRFVRRIEFRVPDSVKEAVVNARASYERRTRALGVDVFQSDLLGKTFCKEHNVSPDAIMQLGFQVAYYLQHGRHASTYESCSTAAFKHGRTETLRPATLETSAFCKAVSRREQLSASTLKKALLECSNMHSKLSREAAMGQGFDRHLFGLLKIAEETRSDQSSVPDLFAHRSYSSLNHNVVSTSTLPSALISFGGFGPVVKDGLGVGYQIQKDTLGLVVSSFPSHGDGKGFVECAGQAYKIIHDCLVAKSLKK